MRAALALAAVLLAACGREGASRPEVLGEINSEYLTTLEFMHHLKLRGGSRLAGETRRELKRWLVAELVDRKLLLQEARRRRVSLPRGGASAELAKLGARKAREAAWDSGDELDEQRRIDRLISLAVKRSRIPTTVQAKRYIKAHPEDFSRADEVSLRQIVVHSAAKMRQVREELEGKTDFAEAARRFSAAPEAEKGGRLGWCSDRDVPPEIWAAVREAETGETAGPVSSPYGLHLVRVLGRRKGGPLPDRVALARAKKTLTRKRREDAVRKYVSGLRERATIRIDFQAVDEL